MNNKGSIFLIRKTRFALLRSLAVFLDGEKNEIINEDSIVELVVSPGPHEVYVKIDWCRSNKFQLNISPEEKIFLICKSSLHGWGNLLTLFYLLFYFNKLMVIEKITPLEFDKKSKTGYPAGQKYFIVVVFVSMIVLGLFHFFIR